MKWLFLIFIALAVVTGNAIVFEQISLSRTIGGFAFNLGILALLLFWWASYFSSAQAKARRLVIGHATLMLALGIGIALSGTTMALTNSCESWIFGSRPTGFLRQLTTHIQSLGYCRELGLGVVLFGLFMAYPSGRLFVGITGRSS